MRFAPWFVPHPLCAQAGVAEWMELIDRLWPYRILGNPASRWLLALVAAAAAYLILRVATRLAGGRLKRISQQHGIAWLVAAADMLQHVRSWFLAILAIYLGSLTLPTFPGRMEQTDILANITAAALLIQVAIWCHGLITFGVTRYAEQRLDADAASVTTIAAIGYLSRIALWVIVLLLILENLGVEVTTLVAGLGIGGIAVALAAQNVLGDLFASLSIVLDKPFVLGDFISVDGKGGSVEHIGLKTTRLRSITGEQLIFPNGDLLNSRIHNFKRMSERRIVFTLSVTYQTPYEKLVAIPDLVRQVIENEPNTRFDRAHFKAYGPSALEYEIVYYVVTPDYLIYMNAQQAINLKLFEIFAREGIEFAYPTQTIFVQPPRQAAQLGLAQ